MAELMNCPRCGRVFVQTLRDICDSCFQEEEEMFDKVYSFIRKQKNRKATLLEVHEKTGVPEETIIAFIKQGRLRLAQFPNLTYPCESCGKPIQKGKLCKSCSDHIVKSIERLEQEEERKREEKKTYYNE